MKKRDLIVLCADLQWKITLETICNRHQSLGLRGPLNFEVIHVPGKTDGSMRREGPELLRQFRPRFEHGLLVLDWEGCGARGTVHETCKQLDEQISSTWGSKGRALVVEPELEAWIIGGHVHFSLLPGLEKVRAYQWLKTNGYWPDGAPKPARPKESIEKLFHTHRVRRTSASYKKIVEHVSLDPNRCRCESYQTFVKLLQDWFVSIQSRTG